MLAFGLSSCVSFALRPLIAPTPLPVACLFELHPLNRTAAHLKVVEEVHPLLAGVLRLLTGEHPHSIVDLRQPRPPAKVAIPREAQGRSIVVLTGAEPVRDLAAQARAWSESLPSGGHIVVVVENRLHARLVSVRRRVRGLFGLAPHEVGGRQLRGPNLKEMQAALQGAGLACAHVFAAHPSTRHPRELVPVSARRDLLAPGHLLVACRIGETQPVPLQALVSKVQHAGSLHPPGADWRVLRVAASEKHKSIVFIGDTLPRVVVRISHSAAACEAETHAHEVLGMLRGRAGVAELVPVPVCAGRIAGEPYFAERAVSGVPIARLIRLDTRATFVPLVESFLLGLNAPPAGHGQVLVPGVGASQFAAPVMARVLPLVQDATLRERAAALLERSLAGAVCRAGLLHGDYGVGNILVSEGRLSGVIDWENAQDAAPPVLDAFNYLDSVQRCCHEGFTLADTVPMLARGEWPMPEELAMLRRALARDGIDDHYLRGFALLYWMRHLAAQLEFWRSDEALTRRVGAVLSRLAD